MNEKPINVKSEIGRLRRVILHRPGAELENITPDTMTGLLFDDIPYLKVAQEEHDVFAKILRDRGAEVLYYDQLAAGALTDEKVRQKFVDQLLRESKMSDRKISYALKKYLMAMDPQTMVRKVMAGVRKDEIVVSEENDNLEAIVRENRSPFYLYPMPNLYFSRDYTAAMGSGLTINHMTFGARKRDSLFMEYIIRYNPLFAGKDVPVWYDRSERWNMEGGDEQVWTKDTVAVGLSQRSSAGAIEKLADRLLKAGEFKRVVALEIPKSHALMHLDTVMTMVDVNKFTVFPEIMDNMGKMNIYILTMRENGKIKIERRSNLLDVLREILGRDDVVLIPTGDGDQIAAEREQWNDGSNTLTIAPGVVVTYDRNYVSNAALRRAGVEVIEISGAELGRGRGGPRCMSMPVWREDV